MGKVLLPGLPPPRPAAGGSVNQTPGGSVGALLETWMTSKVREVLKKGAKDRPAPNPLSIRGGGSESHIGRNGYAECFE